ncbi:hypothetical protein MNBD_NITROSPIRAE01-497 [hydrothermal vent metagenome]|uniref:TRASH domain-containing protein n=1 Tax=hydrothermal vent metagenome TaxID=652676 RepID=A0A3B1CYZ5_9ZZZZ|nr:YHS domain-containing protein [Candidatus Manganitrophaceae bacterium]
MEGLGSFLLFAAFFYFMMRFGCGAHMVNGGHDKHGKKDEKHEHTNTQKEDGKQTDPVCGMSVESDSGYGKMHKNQLYRFCSKKCLDQFDADPEPFLKQLKGGDL